MLCKILIPIIDMGEMKYDENFERNVIGRFGSNDEEEMYEKGNDTVISNMYSRRSYDDNYVAHDVRQNIKVSECECFITDSDGNDISSEWIDNIVESGKMSIMRININPNTIDSDCESELKFWLDDSNKLLNDKEIDNRTKIKHLPKRDMYLVMDNMKYMIHGCKMFGMYKVENAPFYFATLIERISL